MTALVTVDATRLRRAEARLGGTDLHARQALRALVQGRLLVAADANDGTGYELACDALVHHWNTLRCLLDEQLDSRIVKHRLAIAVMEWERLGRTRDALWSVRQLHEASIVDPRELSSREKQFLEASRRTLRHDRLKHHAAIACLPFAIAIARGGAPVDVQRPIDHQVAARMPNMRMGVVHPQSRGENTGPCSRADLPASANTWNGLTNIHPERFISARLHNEDMSLRPCLASRNTYSSEDEFCR